MQKKVMEISCYVAGAGAFGVFLRWLQDQLAFNDAGLPDKSALHVMVPVYIAVCALLFRHIVKGYRKAGKCLPENFFEAFRNEGKLYSLLRWVCGIVMAAGGALLLATSELDKYAGMLQVLSIVAIVAGLSFPLLMAAANKPGSNLSLLCLPAFAPLFLYAVWLVYCYRANSINPVVWSYVLEVFTVIVALVAFFRVAGFPFQNPRPERCLFEVMFAAMLCLMSLADERYMGMHMILLGSALMLLYENWVMVCNLGPIPEKKEEAPAAQESGDGFEHL